MVYMGTNTLGQLFSTLVTLDDFGKRQSRNLGPLDLMQSTKSVINEQNTQFPATISVRTIAIQIFPKWMPFNLAARRKRRQ
mmetsp:Transcript_4185/g.5686  ORF Transcript_4185/g.5686 Transcript_4185/m.5686 type:complete len:81 (-) Transcript_4185:65-307(-)